MNYSRHRGTKTQRHKVFKNFFVPLCLCVLVPLCLLSIANPTILNAEEFPIKITAVNQYEKEKDVFVFERYVILEFKDIHLQADKVTFDRTKNELIAEGNVLLQNENQHISAETLTLNLSTEQATLYKVFVYDDPQLTILSTELKRESTDDYKGKEIKINECKQRIPHWSAAAKKAHLKVNKWVRMQHFTFKVKNVPVFYLPYFHMPLDRDRSTGFLFPSFGPNDRKGFYIGNAFFWAINRNNDLTFYLDRWWDRGWGEGIEYDYALQEGNGKFQGMVLNDNLIGRQWSLKGSVNQEIAKGFKLSGQWDWFSSLDYIQEYENSFSRLARRYKLLGSYITKKW